MDIRRMQCFSETVKSGSYSKAAERLFVSRQALAKTLAKLEDECGVKLLDVDEKGVRPTREGVAFLEQITPLLEEYDKIEDRYRFSGSSKRKILLQIVVSQGALHPFPDLLDRFFEDACDIDVHIEEIHSDGTLDMVDRGDAEIGILGSHPKYLQAFEALPLAHPGYFISVPTQSPLADKTSFELAELDGVPFVTLGERNHLHRFFLEQCEVAGVHPHILIATSEMGVFEHYRTKESALAFACAPKNTQPYKDVVYIPLHMADADLFGTYAIRRKAQVMDGVGARALSPAAQRLWNYLDARKLER